MNGICQAQNQYCDNFVQQMQIAWSLDLICRGSLETRYIGLQSLKRNGKSILYKTRKKVMILSIFKIDIPDFQSRMMYACIDFRKSVAKTSTSTTTAQKICTRRFKTISAYGLNDLRIAFFSGIHRIFRVNWDYIRVRMIKNEEHTLNTYIFI